MSVTDQQLLRDYVESGSEAAFAELARRYVDLVYSVARWTTGDTHSAEDGTQATFLAFARNASRLTDRAVMSGWLYRTAPGNFDQRETFGPALSPLATENQYHHQSD